jgi:hypothetical protein
MAISTPAQIGFADFVGKLISEVFASVVAADMTQEQQLAELVATASLALSAAAAQLASEAEIDAQLALLFPPPRQGVTSAVFTGAPYQPTGSSGAEAPDFAAALGVTLAAGVDFRPDSTAGQALTDAGVQSVRDAARLQLASPRLDALRRMAARGVPRVAVDAGEVRATFTFQLDTTTPQAPTPPLLPAPVLPRPLFTASLSDRAVLAAPAARSFAATASASPPSFRLTLRPASDQAPQATKLQVNVYSSVRIRFRTIL